MNRNVVINRVTLLAGILLGVSIVGACKKGKESDAVPGNFPAGIHFAYPYNGQNDVPVGSQIVVKFAQAPAESKLDGGLTSQQFNLVDSTGTSIRTVMARRPGNDSVVEFKTDGLQPGKTYGINTEGSSGLIPGANSNMLSFTVRKKDVLPGEAPSVVSRNPDPAKGYTYMTFSSFRVLFTESLESSTVIKGESFKFLDASGAQVPGTLTVRGRYLTFDPTSDLRAEEAYTAVLTTDIKDKTGETLDKSYTYDIKPKSPGKTVAQVLELSPNYESGKDLPSSTLVGAPVNTITLESHLLKQDTTHVKSTLFAEMGDATLFPSNLPFIIRKGNVLISSAVEFKLGAAIEAGINTGELNMALSSDATGYIVGNPYSKDGSAPAYVVMTMDISVTAKGTIANSAMTQDIMHVEAVGALTVEGERLVINVVGAIELDLLGLEKATGNLVLRLETPLEAPARVADTEAPTVAAVFPENNDASLGRDITPAVVFSEALDIDSVVAGENIRLIDTSDGSDVDFRAELNGASVLLVPSNVLATGRTYQVEVGPSIRDIAGNELGQSVTNTFSTVFVSTDWAMPISLLALYPGMPCALTAGNWKSGGNKAGYCAGGESSDDNIDVPKMPANRGIQTYFSQSLNKDTVVLSTDACAKDNSISVQEVDSDGDCVGTVPGVLLKKDRSFKFVPNADWTVGKRYVIVIHAGSNGSCDAGEVCSATGAPLNTDVLNRDTNWDHDGDGSWPWSSIKRYRPVAGGPDIEMPFDAVEATADVLTTMRPLPYTDTNGNGVIDAGEISRYENHVDVEISGVGGIISKAEITGEQGLFLSKAMMFSIGSYDAATDRIPVTVYSQHIQGTQLELENEALLGVLKGIKAPTYMQFMRIRNDPIGYIYRTPEGPRFFVKLDLYYDLPYLKVLDLIPISHGMYSKEIQVELDGPVLFKPDGRMVVILKSQKEVTVRTDISAVGFLPGHIDLKIPKGGMKLNLIGGAPKNVFEDARFK